MKRTLAFVIALALVLAIPFAAVEAAGDSEMGELLITQEPEKIQGEVGEIVKVNFYLYPNLPDGRKLDSLSGTMQYDPEFVTLGAINQKDEELNLKSLMQGKAASFQHKIDNGVLRFAFIDAYGVEEEGFWFQAEFRIEKEGATDFIFNGITYTGIDSTFKTVSFMINPVSVGGIYTEGQTIPTGGAAEETFAPLTPAVDTPAPPTATPKPSNGGQNVPVVSTLPTYEPNPTASGIVTPQPPITSIPVKTPDQNDSTSVPQQVTDTPAPEPETPTPESDTPAPGSDTPAPADIQTPEPVFVPTTDDPNQIVEATPFPIGDNNDPVNVTDAPSVPIEPTVTNEPVQPSDETIPEKSTEKEADNDLWLIVGIVAAMVAVLGLGALAIVLLMKRRKMNDGDRD